VFRWLKKRQLVQDIWSAGAYLTPDRIVIHSMSRTRTGVGWYNQPVLAAPADASSDLLGQHMREALNACTWDSLKDDSEDTGHPMLQAAGVKNWRDLENTSKFAAIETDKKLVRILPSRWATKAEGGRGFIPLLESQIDVRWDSTTADLGAALRRGFEAARTRAERE
jgi:hypothetical protein